MINYTILLGRVQGPLGFLDHPDEPLGRLLPAEKGEELGLTGQTSDPGKKLKVQTGLAGLAADQKDYVHRNVVDSLVIHRTRERRPHHEGVLGPGHHRVGDREAAAYSSAHFGLPGLELIKERAVVADKAATLGLTSQYRKSVIGFTGVDPDQDARAGQALAKSQAAVSQYISPSRSDKSTSHNIRFKHRR